MWHMNPSKGPWQVPVHEYGCMLQSKVCAEVCTCAQCMHAPTAALPLSVVGLPHMCSCVLQVLAAHADNLSGEQSSACNTYAATLQ
jgi:hypothetical protein